jgi:hypothetical protein
MAASEASTTNGFRAADDSDREKGLHRTQTSVTMPSELFEKLYLTPKVPRVGDYNRRFANPTALGFVGWVSLVHTSQPGTGGQTDNRSLVISTFTFSIVLMGWGGAHGFSPVV